MTEPGRQPARSRAAPPDPAAAQTSARGGTHLSPALGAVGQRHRLPRLYPPAVRVADRGPAERGAAVDGSATAVMTELSPWGTLRSP